MIESIESESLAEINGFCLILHKIKEEIDKIQSGVFDKIDNSLRMRHIHALN